MGDARDVDDVIAAVRAVHGGASAVERERANAFLHAMSEREDALEIALDALERERCDEACAFFAANLLCARVRERASWRSMSVERRARATARARAAFAATSADGRAEACARRLGMALASAAARGGVEEVMACAALAEGVATTSGVDGVGMRSGTELLALLAEACDEETGSRRELAMACARECERVLKMVKEVFSACGSVRSRERDALRASCVRAARGWLKLDPSGDVIGGLRMSPTEFALAHGPLFEDILRCLAIEGSGCGSAAVDMLVELHQGRSGDESQELQAMNFVTRGLLQHGQAAMESEDSSIARNISLVAVALSERCVNVLVRGDEASLSLVSLLLSLMERHGREVTEVAVDFFLMMDTVGPSSRHESLRAPMHARLVEVLLKQATLPEDFTRWEEALEDEDTFERFREHVVADLLDNCYGVLRGQYFNIISGALSAARSWRDAEAGAFALRAVASRVTEDLEESPSAETETFLMQLLSTVAEHSSELSGIFSSHSLVRASSCRLIESYAQWLGQRSADDKARATLARSVLAYATSSFPHPLAWPRAALAFRSVCSRCARHLRDPSTFAALLEHTERCIGGAPVTFDSADAEDHRTAVMEGLARVIASMPIQQASDAAARLIIPVVDRLKTKAVELAAQIPTNHVAHPEASRAVAADLRLIASSVRFLEFSAKASENAHVEHPAISALATAWPAMEDIVSTRTWQASSVIQAVGEIYVAALLSAKAMSLNMITPMLESVARTFTATKHRCLFEPVSTAVEVASISSPESGASELSPSAPQVGAALSAVFSRMANETVLCARADPTSADTWERAEELFGAARAFIIFAPAQGLANESLFATLDLALAALELREYGPVRASLALLNALISPGEKSKASAPWVSNAARVDDFFLTRGPTLTRTIFHSACSETMPRTALRAAATLLATLVHTAPDIVVGWFAQTISAPTPTPFAPDAREPFLAILSARPPLERTRLIACLCDYFLVCVGVGDVEDLLAYGL